MSASLSRKPKIARKVGYRRIAVASLASTVAIMGVGVSPANADYTSLGMPTASFWMSTTGLSTAWVGYVDTARGAWNTSTGSYIKRNSTAASFLTAKDMPEWDWYGLYTAYGTRSTRTFKIQVNTYYLKQDAGPRLYEWIMSTTTHELGHSLSLADDPVTTQSSLMKHARNRSTVYKPTAYDIQDVARWY